VAVARRRAAAAAAAGAGLVRLGHALGEQLLELGADLPGLAAQLVQELPLLLVDCAVGVEHLPQPARLLGVDGAVSEDVVLDGLVEELLPGGAGRALHALVQLHQEIRLGAVDLAVGVQFLLQALDGLRIDLIDSQQLRHQLLQVRHVGFLR